MKQLYKPIILTNISHGKVAEWSKALVLGYTYVINIVWKIPPVRKCMGSNPILVNQKFFCVKLNVSYKHITK